MIKFIVTADWHFDVFLNQEPISEGLVSKRTKDIEKSIRKMFQHAVENKIEHIFVAGDIFHVRDLISVPVYNLVSKLLQDGKDMGLDITIISGNHDQNTRDMTVTSVESLPCRVITKPKSVFFSGFQFDLVPFSSNVLKEIKKIGSEEDTNKILISHFSIKGSYFSNFKQVSKEGVDSSSSVLEKYKIILLGHHHHPQMVSHKILYVGAPLQHTFSDVGSKRGFYEICISDWKVIPKFIENKESPMFYYLTKEEYASFVGRKTDYIKLVGVSDKEYSSAVNDSRVRGIKKKSRATIKSRFNLSNEESLESIIEDYLVYKRNEIRTVPVQVYKGVALDILKEVSIESFIRFGSPLKIKMSAKNYKAFGAEPVVVDFSSKGITLIDGKNIGSSSRSSNGAGKSTVFDALLFGLFGSTIGKNKLVNSKNKKDCVVELFIEKGKSKATIKRMINCKGNKDTVLFIVDNVDVTGVSNRDTNSRIKDYLGFSKDLFETSVFCSSSFAALTSGEQDKILSSILGLNHFFLAKDIVVSKVKKIESDILKLKDRIKELELYKVEINGEILGISQSLEPLQINHKKEIQEIKNQISVLISNRKEKMEELSFKNTEVSIKIESVEGEISKLMSEIDFCEESLYNQEHKKNGLEKELTKIYKLISSGKCISCEQKVSSNYKSEKISEIKEELFLLENKINELSRKLDDLRVEYLERKEEKESLVRSKVEDDKRKLMILSECKSIDRQIMDKEFFCDRLESLQREKDNNEKIRRNKIDELENKLSLIEKERIKILEMINEELLDELEVLSFWRVGFGASGIRTMLLDKILVDLNKIASEYSELLTDGEIEVIFKTQKEQESGELVDKLHVEITDICGSSNYREASSGEKRRIDLISSLSLYALISKMFNFGFLLLDEVFVKLDEVGRQKVIELLLEVKNDIPSIFVISNQSDIVKEEFDCIMTVVREGRVSRLEVEINQGGYNE